MKTHRWKDIRDAGGKLSEQRLAQIDANVGAEVHTFRALREMLGLTQVQLAKLANMTQGEVSRFESSEDQRIGRVREMVEAIGGELKVVAVVNGQEVRIG